MHQNVIEELFGMIQRIGIEWPMDIKPVLSEKDKKAPFLKEAENNFQ